MNDEDLTRLVSQLINQYYYLSHIWKLYDWANYFKPESNKYINDELQKLYDNVCDTVRLLNESLGMFFEYKGGCNPDDTDDKILSLDWEYAELNLTDKEDVEFRLDGLAYAVQDAYRKYRAATRTILFV